MARVKTLTELITEASNLSDETAANQEWVEWFNNGIDALSDSLFLDKLEIIPAAGSGFPLPADVKNIISVGTATNKVLMYLPYTDNVNIGYKVVGDVIYLQGLTDTQVELYYYRIPAYLSTASIDVPLDLPDAYVRALIYYACAEIMAKEDEPDRYELFKQNYNEAKAVLDRAVKQKKQGRIGAWGVVR